jgi:membrane protein DedA with SNARE-associated domain
MFAALLWAASWLLMSIYFFFLADTGNYFAARATWGAVFVLLATAVIHDFWRARHRPTDTKSTSSL